ncbi:MAG: glutathione S-transferase N-terminal domain-containing protein [Pseudomonadota bacterium]
MLQLYQFPISHFCEKARWALEYKHLEYKKINLLPGLHIKKARKLSGKGHLPILVSNSKVINESSKILDYLDAAYPNKQLTPEDEKLKNDAKMWEAFADQELGPDVRGLCYNTLLDYPEITIPFFATNGPWYSNLLLNYTFPKMSLKMRELMKLDDENVLLIKKRLTKAIDKLYQHTQQHKYLVGDQFSRADLAVAALLAPLCKPQKYGLEWPEEFPEPLRGTIEKFGNKLDWVDRIYIEHR